MPRNLAIGLAVPRGVRVLLVLGGRDLLIVVKQEGMGNNLFVHNDVSHLRRVCRRVESNLNIYNTNG